MTVAAGRRARSLPNCPDGSMTMAADHEHHALRLDRERRDLALADRHVAEGERRIARQFSLLRQMSGTGFDTALARDLLRLLEQTLATWQEHRRLILATISRLEHEMPMSPGNHLPRREGPGPPPAPREDATGGDRGRFQSASYGPAGGGPSPGSVVAPP